MPASAQAAQTSGKCPNQQACGAAHPSQPHLVTSVGLPDPSGGPEPPTTITNQHHHECSHVRTAHSPTNHALTSYAQHPVLHDKHGRTNTHTAPQGRVSSHAITHTTRADTSQRHNRSHHTSRFTDPANHLKHPNPHNPHIPTTPQAYPATPQAVDLKG